MRPWRVIFKAGKSFLQCLIDNKDTVDFAVLLFTPDDSSIIRGENYMTPRDNILFELGLYMGRLGPDRVLVVCPSDARPKLPSDFTGYGVVDYDPFQGEPSEYLWPATVQIKSQFQDLWKVRFRDLRKRGRVTTLWLSTFPGCNAPTWEPTTPAMGS